MKMPETEAVTRDLWDDLQPLLDQELSRLPDIYRLPILLCDLEGKAIKEASRQLGWRQGTLAGRLARGRKLLARRLTQRGVVLSSGLLAGVLSENAASACVPTSLVVSTVKAAGSFATATTVVTGTIPVNVVALTEGVLKAMLLTKLKIAMAVLVVVAVVGVGSSGLLYRTQAAEPAKPASTQKEEKQKPEESQPSLASLAEQLQKLQKAVDELREEVKGLRANLGRVPDRPILPAPPLPVPPRSPFVPPPNPTPPPQGPVPIAPDFGFPIVKGPRDREQIFSFWVGFFH
jgi:hypothetical protein